MLGDGEGPPPFPPDWSLATARNWGSATAELGLGDGEGLVHADGEELGLGGGEGLGD